MAIERDLQPINDEYNSEFARAYIRQAAESAGDDGRIGDPDATLGGLFRHTKEALIPTVRPMDAAIRTGLPWHGAALSLLFRHTVEFTLIFLICLVVDLFVPALHPKLIGWCIINFLLFGTLSSICRREEPFLGSIAGLWPLFSMITFLPLLSEYSLLQQVFLTTFMVVFVSIAFFPGFNSFSGAVEKCVTLALATTLLSAISMLRPGTVIAFPLLLGLLLFANYLMLLPFGMNLQHWFAANRYASLEDVRRYGQGATADSRTFAMRLSVVTNHLHVLTGSMGSTVAIFIAWLKCLEGSELSYVRFVLWGVAGFLTAGLFGFLTGEFSLRRVPRFGAYFSSFYVTWRSLAAWLSYEPVAAVPTAFSFRGIWSSLRFRRASMAAVASIYSAIAIAVLRDWTILRLNESTGPLTFSELWAPEFVFTVILGAVVTPPLMLFLAIHTMWGHLLQAYSEHFEEFDDEVAPPLLSLPVDS